MPTEKALSSTNGRGGRLRLVAFTIAFGLTAIAAAGSVLYFLLSNLLTSGSQTAAEFGHLQKAAVQILLFSAAVGVIAMAALEVIKRLTPVRALYHASALSRRLGSEPAELLTEMVYRHRYSNLDVPIEQLTAQLQTALDQIVASVPEMALTWRPADEVAVVREGPSLAERRLIVLNAVIGRNFFEFGSPKDVTSDPAGTPHISADISAASAAPGKGPSSEDESLRTMEIALRSSVDAGLDSLQVAIGSGWKRLVRLSAALVAAVSAIAVSALYGVGYVALLVAMLGGFVLGGFFAWLARDLVAGIERWRG